MHLDEMEENERPRANYVSLHKNSGDDITHVPSFLDAIRFYYGIECGEPAVSIGGNEDTIIWCIDLERNTFASSKIRKTKQNRRSELRTNRMRQVRGNRSMSKDLCAHCIRYVCGTSGLQSTLPNGFIDSVLVCFARAVQRWNGNDHETRGCPLYFSSECFNFPPRLTSPIWMLLEIECMAGSKAHTMAIQHVKLPVACTRTTDIQTYAYVLSTFY